MSEDNARKWVAALRSGEYKQAQGALNVPEVGFCCWGVACDISKVGGWDVHSHYRVKYDVHSGTPPHEVIDWVGRGLYSLDLVDSRGGETDTLIDMNDSGEFTFDQIADVIEAYLNGWNLRPGVF